MTISFKNSTQTCESKVCLVTYGPNEDTLKFSVSKTWLTSLLKREFSPTLSIEEFLNEYTWDDAEIIQDRALQEENASEYKVLSN